MTNEMSLEIVQKAASPRRVRTHGGQFRKLPELTLHRPSLRLRGDTLWLTIKQDGKHQLRKKPWIRIVAGADASDLEILSATKRAIDQDEKTEEGSDLPVASGSLATERRQALQEIDSLKLSVKVTGQRGRHLDKGCGSRYGSRSEPISAAGMTRKEAAVKPTSALPRS